MAGNAVAQAIGAWLHHAGAETADVAGAGAKGAVSALGAIPSASTDAVAGLVHGIVTGQAPSAPAATATPAKAAAPASAAPAAKSPSPMDQFIAAQIQRQSDPNYGAQASSTPTPLDIIRAAAVNNGGLSLSQLGSLSESVSKTVPQATKPVPASAKELALTQYMDLANKMAASTASDPNYSKSQVGAAHQQLLENLRAGLTTANQINDVATGMPVPIQ